MKRQTKKQLAFNEALLAHIESQLMQFIFSKHYNEGVEYVMESLKDYTKTIKKNKLKTLIQRTFLNIAYDKTQESRIMNFHFNSLCKESNGTNK